MKQLLLIFLVAIATHAYTQGIENADQARQKAQDYLDVLMPGISSDGANIQRVQRGPDSKIVWHLELAGMEALMFIDAESGVLAGFSDLKLCDEILDRGPGQARRLDSDAAAWQAGEEYLAKAGLAPLGFERGPIKWTCDEPGASTDKNNRADRCVLHFEQRVPGYEGAVNEVAATMDVVTGKPRLVAGSVSWRFDAPRSTMDIDAALPRLKAVFDAEARRWRAGGYEDMADRHVWPGDETVRAAAVMRVVKGGGACAGSDYGERLAEQWKARVGWSYPSDNVSVAIDAENGQPIHCSVSKQGKPIKLANGQTGYVYQKLPGDSPSPPQTHVWAALGGVGIAGALVWLKALRH